MPPAWRRTAAATRRAFTRTAIPAIRWSTCACRRTGCAIYRCNPSNLRAPGKPAQRLRRRRLHRRDRRGDGHRRAGVQTAAALRPARDRGPEACRGGIQVGTASVAESGAPRWAAPRRPRHGLPALQAGGELRRDLHGGGRRSWLRRDRRQAGGLRARLRPDRQSQRAAESDRGRDHPDSQPRLARRSDSSIPRT